MNDEQNKSPHRSSLITHRFKVAVIDAIKLLEAGWGQEADQVWVVTCPAEQQVERLMTTRGMSEAEARQRVAAQPAQQSRLAQATVVIDNGGSQAHTRAQVEAAWQNVITAIHTGK